MICRIQRDYDFGAPVGFVVSVDADCHAVAEHLTPAGIFGETVEAGERVRRNRGLDPLDGIAVVVVMRRLDQNQMEDRGAAVRHGCRRGSGQIDRLRAGPPEPTWANIAIATFNEVTFPRWRFERTP